MLETMIFANKNKAVRSAIGLLVVVLLMLNTTPPLFAEDVQKNDIAAIAFAVRVVGDENRTRIVVDFDRTIEYNVMFLENPYRVLIDLPETIFSFGGDRQDRQRGMVSDFRQGSIAPGRSRIVLQTKVPTRLDNASLGPFGKDGHRRLKLDFVKTDLKDYRNTLFLQTSAFGTSGNVAYKGDRVRRGRKSGKNRKYTITIDPGHGGIDGGTEGRNGAIEKNITLAFSKALKLSLERTGIVDVVLTRQGDVFVSLAERVAIARRVQADLLISIHADSLKQNQVRGATIYTLSAEGSDKLSQLFADKENRADLIAGLVPETQNSEVTDILIELTRRETMSFSQRFASTLVAGLKGSIKLIKNPHRSANFVVLRAPEIPSILLELGYLSNQKDALQLESEAWVTTTAGEVKKAIMVYLLQRS